MFTKIMILPLADARLPYNDMLMSAAHGAFESRANTATMLCGASRKGFKRRRILWAIFALTFVPYLLPARFQPPMYKDGKSPEEIARRQKERSVSKTLGGDIRKVEFAEDLFFQIHFPP